MFALMMFLIIGAVSAHDDAGILDNSTDVQTDGELLGDAVFADDVPSENSSETNSSQSEEVIQNASFEKVSQGTYLIGNDFKVKLLDENGTGIANKTVTFTIKGKIINATTDAKGVATFKLTLSKGSYTVSYKFNESGYNPASGSKSILLLKNPVSALKVSSLKVCAGIKKYLVFTLTADGIPLSGRNIKIVFNKKTYSKKTNSKGQTKLLVYVSKGKYSLKYSFAGEKNIKASSKKSTVNSVLYKNVYKTKYRTVWIDADGGFTKDFLNDIAKKLRVAGWKVVVRGIGPGQHSITYKKVKNAVYMPFYNGLCAGTIEEMAKGYYGGLLKKNKAVLTPAWYTADWTSAKMSQYREDITPIKMLKRAWDDNFSPKSYKGLANPAKFMTKNNIKYCVSDTTYKIVEQFLKGGWVATHK